MSAKQSSQFIIVHIVTLLVVIHSCFSSVISLANLATVPRPWHDIQTDGIQISSVYVGANPRQMELFNMKLDSPTLPTVVRDLGIKYAEIIRKKMNVTNVEFEAWPVRYVGPGHYIWIFARWRNNATSMQWKWLNKNNFDFDEDLVDMAQTLYSWNATDHALIFDDMLEQRELYDLPIFSNCVWSNPDDQEILFGWIHPDLRDKYKKIFTRNICHFIPQPARFNDKPITFVLSQNNPKFFHPEITWYEVATHKITPIYDVVHIKDWGDDFANKYKNDVAVLSGELEAVYPISGKRTKFDKKSAAEPGSRLLEVVEYLEERYKVLGVPTTRQSWTWRNMTQVNLVAYIKGIDSDASRKPVLIADHFDTAFAGEVYDKSKQRISVPGADDNASATSALLRAAEVMKDLNLGKDVLLVHLTGEEYPSASIGTNQYLMKLLKTKSDITGLLLMDMIGWKDPKSGNMFQINAAGDKQSIKIASVMMGASFDVSPEMIPVYRSRFDKKSYLYNTDGIEWTEAGYPVVLANEHINLYENFNRGCYHEMCDTLAQMDIPYATGIVKVVIETAARLARLHSGCMLCLNDDNI
jgi:hypothetical protein